MAKTDHSGEKPPAKPPSDKERREQQLAQALRANLRRRKSAPASARKPSEDGE